MNYLNLTIINKIELFSFNFTHFNKFTNKFPFYWRKKLDIVATFEYFNDTLFIYVCLCACVCGLFCWKTHLK